MQTLRKKLKQYGAVLGQKPILRTTPQHDGSYHVELVSGKYHYVRTERGAENERRIAKNEDEILFWLISDLVFDLACKHELKNRIPGQDFRRLLFSKRIELMGTVKPEWAERTQQDIQKVLAEHPYNDSING